MNKKRTRSEQFMAAVVLGVGAVALLVHNFVLPFRYPSLVVISSMLATMFMAAIVVSIRDARTIRAKRPKLEKKKEARGQRESEIEYEPAPPLTPAEIDLRSVSAILNWFALLSIGCALGAIVLTIRIFPDPRGWIFLGASIVAVGLIVFTFATASRLGDAGWAYWSAVGLLILELPAFPMSIFAILGLYYLWRARRTDSADASAMTVVVEREGVSSR